MIAGLYELPEGWRWVRLGEACQPTEVRDPGKQPESEFTYVDISSIDNTEGQIISPKRLKGAEAPSRARKVIRANDVIFATTRPYLKNIALVPDEFDNQICSTGFCVLRAKRSLTDSSWLFYLCRADLVVEQLNERMRGASYPAVTDVDVLSTLIPLPPLPEQRRIVARIEALFERIREARRLREAARRDADALLQAAMAEVFPHPDLPMPNGWKLLAVADFASKPQYGYTQSAKEEPVGPKFLRITDIQNGRVNWESVPYCECDDATLQKYRLQPGDLLFARSGATTGKTFLVTECPEAVFASYLLRLRVTEEKISPQYVYWFFQSPSYWAQIKPRGAAQPNMNAPTLSKIQVPIPKGRDEQEHIVKYLDSLAAQVQAVKARQAETEAELRRLEQAILERALRGGL